MHRFILLNPNFFHLTFNLKPTESPKIQRSYQMSNNILMTLMLIHNAFPASASALCHKNAMWVFALKKKINTNFN